MFTSDLAYRQGETSSRESPCSGGNLWLAIQYFGISIIFFLCGGNASRIRKARQPPRSKNRETIVDSLARVRAPAQPESRIAYMCRM